MSYMWKKILYWVSIIITVMPVSYIDIALVGVVKSYSENADANMLLLGVLITGTLMVLAGQCVAARYFVRASRQKRFHDAFKSLCVFGLMGLTAVIFMMLYFCAAL